MRLVYCVAFAPFKNCFVTTEDKNTGRSLGDPIEATRITYSRYKPKGVTDLLIVRKPTPRITNFEERQGD